jgi:hypothetical protein
VRHTRFVAEWVQGRYKDAYFFADSAINAGKLVKTLGVIAAVICIVVVGLSIYVLGMLIAAQGQVLMAMLDTALNTSPYLDAESRAEAMSLVSIPPLNQNVDNSLSRDAETDWAVRELRADGHTIEIMNTEPDGVMFKVDSELALNLTELRELAEGKCSYDELKARHQKK